MVPPDNKNKNDEGNICGRPSGGPFPGKQRVLDASLLKKASNL